MRTASNAALTIILIGLSMLAISCGRGSATASRGNGRLTEDEKHRLYAAALAVSDSPLDSEVFKGVCQRIEIFDASGKPNDKYLGFVSDHIHWSMDAEGTNFRSEINTGQKARDYIIK